MPNMEIFTVYGKLHSKLRLGAICLKYVNLLYLKMIYGGVGLDNTTKVVAVEPHHPHHHLLPCS